MGAQGPEYRVGRPGFDLTAARGRLLNEPASVGALGSSSFADIVGFRTDLVECPLNGPPSPSPEWALVGGTLCTT